MRHATVRSHPAKGLVLVIMALLGAALACNLAIGQDDARPTAVPEPTVERPTVEIIQPVEGARFVRGQTVTVQARATSASGVSLIRLEANGVTVTEQRPDSLDRVEFEVLMDYQADTVGTVVLGVQAFSGGVAGARAQRSITVLDQLDPGTIPLNTQTVYPATSTPFNPVCRARVNAGGLRLRTGPGLNYDIILNFSAGDEPQITGYADRTDGRWWQLVWNGRTGWSSAAYTSQLGDCSAVRPVAIPPTPTPQPSDTPPPTLPGATATPTLPDLRLSLLEGPSSVQLGADGTFLATYVIEVENTGGQPSGAFRVGIVLPDGSTVTENVLNLGAQSRTLVPLGGLPVTFTTPGIRRILVTVDDLNQVTESNETNNQAYRDITVNPGPATHTPQPTNTEVAPPEPTNTPPPTDTPDEGDGEGDGGSAVAPFSPITAASAAQVETVDELTGHGGEITNVTFSPTGTMLASSSRDGTVRLWDASTGDELRVLAGHTDRVRAVSFSPDGSQVASASWDGTVRVWNVGSGAEVGIYDHGAEVNHVAFSPDGARLASGGVNPGAAGGLQGLARVWDMAGGVETGAIETFGPVSGVALITPTTLVVATRAQDCSLGGGTIEIYDVVAGAVVSEFSGHSGSIEALAVSPGGAMIAGSGQASLCAGNGTGWVWEGGGTLRATLDYGSVTAITGLAFNPSGDLVAASGEDGAVKLWDIASSAQVAALQDQPGPVDSVAFSPNGVWIGSGGADQAVRLWAVQ